MVDLWTVLAKASSVRQRYVEESAKRRALEAKLKLFEEQQALAERESSEERAQFVRSKTLLQLKPYHRVQDCRKKGACKDCGRKHSSKLINTS